MSVSFQVFRGSEDGSIVPDTTTRTLQPTEVYIETTHSGLCGTDEHYLKTGMALGHEGIGIVRQIGSSVTDVKVGARVGYGYIHRVCGICKQCLNGRDQFCEGGVRHYGSHDHDIGTFGEGVVWDASCVVPIPDGYDSADAAPLMCAGVTVWTSLSEHVRSTDRVGIMGIGGLGHLAIKLAAAMGCQVVVLSSTEAKREEALSFGASEYYVWKAGQEIPNFKQVDHLLLCGSANVDYPSLLQISILPLMAYNGTIFPLTVDHSNAPIPLLSLNNHGIRIQGVFVGSRASARSLVEFAAEKKITPTLMKFPLDKGGIEDAMEVLRTGKMRYRGVLVRQ
ncbi:hypothetical protein N7495_003382 [Penicillium taxi]|uniref:uncharacterized protein n=1 Tax=Penicillium taxi TaxID=168475 RepID=UPI0025450AFC|nr:uncharacterized protein N7495_003382 [Penicillium taxi]KAJ5902854.1 hypothetical protein N7495_003382 [Penicillium taxi]